MNIKNGNNIQLLSEIYGNDLKRLKFNAPLIFISFKKSISFKIDISDDKFENKEYYLKKLKDILDLENPIKSSESNGKNLKALIDILDEDNYIITNDNFRKMVLIIYRIMANVPVIVMGETGCGKTLLIKKLSQLINNGKEKLEIISIHPGITDNYLIEKMNEINEKAKKLNLKEDLWIFFDELNTCDSLVLFTEIFLNRSFGGVKLSKNIKILGACNPYRKRKGRLNKYHNGDYFNDLVYLVKLLPQSLMYYVFSFGYMGKEDEDEYITNVISKIFNKKEEKLKEKTKNAISACHQYLKGRYDPSIVSLREISKFTRCCDFFLKYYKIKNGIKNRLGNEKAEKIKSIIISIYICYYIRLTREERIDLEKNHLQYKIIELIDWEIDDKENKNEKAEKYNLLDNIKNKDFINEIQEEIKKNYNMHGFNQFSDILSIEESFIIEQKELEEGIGLNNCLKENIFLLFVSITSNIPLIIIGKSGIGKSLSSQLISKSLKGKYSKSEFFKSYPYVFISFFRGSISTTPDDIEKIFKIAENKLKGYKDSNISLILFDEIGLAERSKYNPLNVLYHKLDENSKLNENGSNYNNMGLSFIGITDLSLELQN